MSSHPVQTLKLERLQLASDGLGLWCLDRDDLRDISECIPHSLDFWVGLLKFLPLPRSLLLVNRFILLHKHLEVSDIPYLQAPGAVFLASIA